MSWTRVRRPNNTDGERVVFEKLVGVSGAAWIRLVIDAASLPRTSYLEVVSVADGHKQRLDAAELRRWSNTSAYFNGSMLYVRLVAAPRSSGVLVRSSVVEVGMPSLPVGPLSQCGPQDNRTPSTDKRTGRLMPIGCTAWLISSTNCFITAGHCRSSSPMTVQFNVPPSSSTGTVNHPGPQDQYPVDMSTLVGAAGGTGADWAVFKTQLNGTTGKHAGAVQGAFFQLAFSKPAVNNTIRITGYGVDRDQRTRNQTNQTHTGPLQSNSGTRLCYVTDTEGGNSGSPVIDEATGAAVGVHTHGGCRTTGTGCNSGTSTTLSAFRTAIQNLRCEPPLCSNSASFTSYGAGCATAVGSCALAYSQNWQSQLANQTTSATKIGIMEYSRPRTNACGVDLWTRSRSGNVTVTVSLNELDLVTGKPTKVRASGKVVVGPTEQMYSVRFTPTLFEKNALYIVVFDNADQLVLPTTNTGTVGVHYEHANGGWSAVPLTDKNWQYRIHHADGGQVPLLSSSNLPLLGKSFSVDLSQAPAARPVVLLMGLSRSSWAGFALPLDLTILGAQGCQLLASSEMILPMVTDNQGSASRSFSLPKLKGLCGQHLYYQYLALDQKANKLGWVFSNAGDAHLGSQQ
jgi:V8-like Glu-specific endopeptidase